MNEVVEQAPAIVGASTRYDNTVECAEKQWQPSRQECLRDYEVKINNEDIKISRRARI